MSDADAMPGRGGGSTRDIYYPVSNESVSMCGVSGDTTEPDASALGNCTDCSCGDGPAAVMVIGLMGHVSLLGGFTAMFEPNGTARAFTVFYMTSVCVPSMLLVDTAESESLDE